MSAPGRPGLPRAFFLPTPAGQRFCLFHPPPGGRCLGRVLHLHPFAEELNTTRRVVARQARALAQAGFAVLQVDLRGCGDSEGELADATWDAWLQDAHHAHAWLADQTAGPLWLWGLRSGSLLATALAARLPRAPHLLLWQPVINGQQMLQQFLRLHAAGQWLDRNDEAGKATKPAQLLASGQPVEIAGYTLTPALANGLGAARMQAVVTGFPGRLVWLETSTQPQATPGPASTAQLDTWRAAGWQVTARAVNGPAFWQTVGSEDAPALITATLQALGSAGESVT